MENEISQLTKNTFEKEKNDYRKKNLLNFFIFINFIYLIILTSLIVVIFKLKNQLNKYMPILNDIKIFFKNNKIDINNINNINNINSNSFEKNDYILKAQYNNDINFYKNILQLYIENKTEFYIKCREKNMKLGGRYYNDSNVTTIQDKLNWLMIMKILNIKQI